MESAPPPTIGFEEIAFHIHWDVVGVVAALALGYWYGLRRLAPLHAPSGEPPVTGRRIAWFVSGLVLFTVARSWPLHDIGDQSLFSFHMIEHLILVLAVPPMLLKGTPPWLMRLLVMPIFPVIRFLTRPLVALVVFNAILAAIHAPAVIEAMLRSEAAHLLIHLGLIIAAMLMWWPVIGPIPELPRLAPFMAMGYLFLQSLVPTVPASFLTFASAPVYDVYADLPRLWGLSVLDDQLIAGLIMKVGGGLVLWTIITIIWFRWAAEEERLTRRDRAAFVPPA